MQNAAPVDDWKVPQSIKDHYKAYVNKTDVFKVFKRVKTKFEIDERYDIIDSVGQGAYGVVVAAKDKKTGDMVAIKKIEKAFEHKVFTRRTLREIRICRLMKHDNVMGIKTIMLPKSREEFDDLYVVSDLMQTDLSSIIKSPQPLSDDHIQFFIYQILRGLKYIHSTQIVHRDLKPRNLLVNSNCDLKICDFGLARSVIADIKVPGLILTDYVATRWYRAPELLLGFKDYGPSVDVWSVGCILAELLGRKSFLCGSSSNQQLKMIIDLVGTPTEADISNIPEPKIKDFLRSIPIRPAQKMDKKFPKANPLAIDLLQKMLMFDIKKRCSIDKALEHPYMKNLHFPEDEPVGDVVNKGDFEFEMYDLTKEQLKDLIYDEI